MTDEIEYEQTIDPGWLLLLGTALFCCVSNALLPCFVALGRRYEKRRIAEAGRGQDASIENDARVDTSSRYEPEYNDTASSIQSYVIRENKGKTKGGSVVSGTSSGVRVLLDKILIPPYNDDCEGSILASHKTPLRSQANSTVSGTPSANPSTTPSAAASSNMDSFVSAKTHESGNISLLDARRGRAPRRKRRALNDVELRRRTQYAEYVADLKAKGANVDDDLDAREHGFKETRNSNNLRRRPGTRSEVSSVRTPSGSVAASEISKGYSSKYSGSKLSSRYAASSDPSVLSVLEDNLSPEDAADANDYALPRPPMEGEEFDLCCGRNVWWKPSNLLAGFDRLVDVSEYDREMQRIVRLAWPFTLSAVLYSITGLIEVALIAHFLGTDAILAWTIVELVVGLVSEFIGGVIEAEMTLIGHAYGARNYKLAGQYVQISALLYTILLIPILIILVFFMDEIVFLLGYDENIAKIARDYSLVVVFGDVIEGIGEAYEALLDVIDRHIFNMCLGLVEEFISLASVFSLLLMMDDATLATVGAVQLGIGVVFLILYFYITVSLGWVDDFLPGMVGSNAWISNRIAYWTLINTALPLSFGSLIAYGEWEILTVFAANMGQYELAAWGILGDVWEAFEEITDAVADAGEVRCSYHMGAADGGRARVSAYKSIMLSTMVATLVTAALFILGEDMATWLTPDPELQRMIAGLLPWVGLGNVMFSGGMVCWALIGAQGRYRLATLVSVICSWGLTIPLGGVCTYYLHWNLEGLAASIVVGYSMTATCLTFILFRSDWGRLSKHIVEINQLEDDELDNELHRLEDVEEVSEESDDEALA